MDRCPHCQAPWPDDQTCADHFHQMAAWELEHQLYDVHHLMVLCYHLQHPHLYSPEGLAGAKQMLASFLEEGLTPQQMRGRIRAGVDSGTRAYKIKGTAENHGAYDRPVVWRMWAGDVVRGGIDRFYANVRLWADATLKALRESGGG